MKIFNKIPAWPMADLRWLVKGVMLVGLLGALACSSNRYKTYSIKLPEDGSKQGPKGGTHKEAQPDVAAQDAVKTWRRKHKKDNNGTTAAQPEPAEMTEAQAVLGKLIEEKKESPALTGKPAGHNGQVNPDGTPKKNTKTKDPNNNTANNSKPCRYAANVMVRKVLNPKAKKKKYLTTLDGNAKVRCDTTDLYAPEIKIFGKKGNTIKLNQSVRIVDQENNTVITGGYGEYFKGPRFARLLKDPLIVHTDPKTGVKTNIYCLALRRDFKRKISRCMGNVRIFREDWEARAEVADYYENRERIILEGNPVVRKSGEYYTAQQIHFQNPHKGNEGYVFLTGSARIVTVGENASAEPTKAGSATEAAQPTVQPATPSPNTEPKLVQTVIRAEEIKRFTTKNRERGIAKRIGNIPVRITRLGTEMVADTVRTKGAKNEFIEASDSITMWDPAQAMLIAGTFLYYDKTKDYGRMLDEPEVYLIDAENEVIRARVQSKELERLFATAEVRFKGGTTLTHYELTAADVTIDSEDQSSAPPKEEPKLGGKKPLRFLAIDEAMYIQQAFSLNEPPAGIQALGEHATYYEAKELMLLEGNAALRQKGSMVSSNRIWFEPKQGRIQLTGGIRGWLVDEQAEGGL